MQNVLFITNPQLQIFMKTTENSEYLQKDKNFDIDKLCSFICTNVLIWIKIVY